MTKQELINAVKEVTGGHLVSRKDIEAVRKANGLDVPRWIYNDRNVRWGRGKYDLSLVEEKLALAKAPRSKKATVSKKVTKLSKDEVVEQVGEDLAEFISEVTVEETVTRTPVSNKFKKFRAPAKEA